MSPAKNNPKAKGGKGGKSVLKPTNTRAMSKSDITAALDHTSDDEESEDDHSLASKR